MSKSLTPPSRRMALICLSLAILLPSLSTSIANVGLPTLARAFHASFDAVQWIVLAYLLAITTLIVGVGRLADLIGRKRLLLAGILLFMLASLLCGTAATLPLLIAARAAQGLGAAAMMALTVAFVSETVPKTQTGRAMGLLGTMSAIGTALGPSLGGLLIAGLGWQAIFLVNAPLAGLTLFLAARYLPPDRAAPSLAKLPVMRLTMLRDPVLGAGLMMNGLVSTVMMTTLVVGPFYLSRALSLDAAVVGLVMSVGPVIAALAGIPAGRIADRYGAPRTMLCGLVGIAAGCCLLAVIPATFGIAGYIAPIAAITSSYAVFQTANNTTVMSGAHPDERGVVSGMLSLSRNLGLIAGTSVMGGIFAFAAAATDLSMARPEAVAFGMRVTFAAAATLVIAGVAIASTWIRFNPGGGLSSKESLQN